MNKDCEEAKLKAVLFERILCYHADRKSIQYKTMAQI